MEQINKGRDNSSNSEEERRRTFEARLQEYQVSRNIWLESWRIRHILIGLNIATMGSLVGLSLTSTSPHIFLSVLSLVSSSLGIIWVGENYWVAKLLINIEKNVLPGLRTLASDQNLFHEVGEPLSFWKVFRGMWKGKMPGAAVGLLLFWLPSVLSLVGALYFHLCPKLSQNPDVTQFVVPVTFFWALFAVDFILCIPLTWGGISWFNEHKRYLDLGNNR